MSRHEVEVPKPTPSSNWNVVRSQSVPSGVSGTHAVAKSKASTATDQSILNNEETVALRARRNTFDLVPSPTPVLKQ